MVMLCYTVEPFYARRHWGIHLCPLKRGFLYSGVYKSINIFDLEPRKVLGLHQS